MRISDWSSDVCSSDLDAGALPANRLPDFGKGGLDKLPNTMGLPRRQHVVIGIRPLHDPPPSIHVVSCMPPIALGVQVAAVEAVLQAELDGCNGSQIGRATCRARVCKGG